MNKLRLKDNSIKIVTRLATNAVGIAFNNCYFSVPKHPLPFEKTQSKRYPTKSFIQEIARGHSPNVCRAIRTAIQRGLFIVASGKIKTKS